MASHKIFHDQRGLKWSPNGTGFTVDIGIHWPTLASAPTTGHTPTTAAR
ncbi:hypothetical protein GZH49_39635 [Nocardia terpenica]